MVDAINRFDLTGMGAAQTDDVPGFDKAPLDDILQMTFPVDPAIKDKVVTQLKTTSSVLPLTVNDAVLGYVNYFSGRGHKTIENGLIRAGKYDAMITKIFRRRRHSTGTDPAGPGGIRLHAARGFGSGSRRGCGSSSSFAAMNMA